MPEVQNVGAADYAQYQPSQYQGEAYVEDYNTQPEVYDEQMAEIQAANKSRKGAMILTGTIVAGLGLLGGYFIGKHGKASKSDMDAIKKELDELKNSDAIKNYDKLKQAADEVEKEVAGRDFWNWWGIKDFVKNKFAFLKEDTKKAADEAKEAAEDAANNAKEKAEEAAESAVE